MFMQIPPAPPRPDFEASREKLQKLGDGEGTMTKEEFTKMKQELEAYEIFQYLFSISPMVSYDFHLEVYLAMLSDKIFHLSPLLLLTCKSQSFHDLYFVENI